MAILELLFWISLSLLFYCYIGYGILVYLFNRIAIAWKKKKTKGAVDEWPQLTLIVAAYNEAVILEEKIRNTYSIDYPKEKLRIVFVTDGSTDGSDELIRQFSEIHLLHQAKREGKYAAICRAMRSVDSPFVVFSDANTMLNPECLKKMMVHYDNHRVGGVAGEKKIGRDHSASSLGEAEGLYWQYESRLKKIDADFNTVTGAAGELFSIRTTLFRELGSEVILDDFVISMQVCLEGYKIAYEPGAFATELPSASIAEEAKRKIRISAGAYQSIGYLKKALNIFRHPLLSFQFISRRLLRWIFCPLMLIIMGVSNLWIVVQAGSTSFYDLFLIGQASFYLLAFVGWLIIRSGRKAGPLSIPFYFVFMNYCLVMGFFRFARGKHSVLWEKSMRLRNA